MAWKNVTKGQIIMCKHNTDVKKQSGVLSHPDKAILPDRRGDETFLPLKTWK